MIVVKLQGGLGNQLFQWSHGHSLSNKFQTELFLDLGFYNNQSGVTPRKFELDKFPSLNWNQYKNSGERFIRITDSFKFSDINVVQNNNYYLDGYWQSEKYFHKYSSQIREILKPDVETSNKLNSILTDNSVSIHIRRTDYVSSNGYHPVQSIDYYNQGLELIKNYDRILVFSDDIEWCKSNLKYDNTIFINNLSDIENLWLMSMCKNNIIANSSFSWWAAWINNNPNKIVVSPSKWFGDHANLNTSDIIPKNWQII
jgi:hypothetical protein